MCPSDYITLPCGCEITLHGTDKDRHRYGFTPCRPCHTTAKISQLTDLVHELEIVLLGLQHYGADGGCWCDAFDRGSVDHSHACKNAREAIAKVEADV